MEDILGCAWQANAQSLKDFLRSLSSLSMATDIQISSCFDPSYTQSYNFRDISEALVRAEFKMVPPIYLTSDDSLFEHLEAKNGIFHVLPGDYIVWGEKKKTDDNSKVAKPVFLQPAGLQLLDNEFDIVRKYLLKHAEIAQYLTDSSFPGRLNGTELREKRKAFKKRVSEPISFYIVAMYFSKVFDKCNNYFIKRDRLVYSKRKPDGILKEGVVLTSLQEV
jgi:hypothetical protein